MNDFLEFEVEANSTEFQDEEITVYVHTKDRRLIAFNDVCANPVIYKGLLHIDHLYVGTRMTSQVRVEDFSHLSYYHTERRKNG